MGSNKQFNTYTSVPPDEEIVISGIAGRFPDSDNIKLLQDNLFNKVDLGSEDNRRWENVYYGIPARSGKINNAEKFDAHYFNMTSEEGHLTDPICRMLLEHTYEAIVDAGVNPKELRGSKTGVFIGTCASESIHSYIFDKTQVAGFPILRCNKFWLANCISNWLNLKGPSYCVDSACSSSLYAMEKAYTMIRSGECDAAIVGGSNLCLHPFITMQYFNLGVLSDDGHCKPFDVNGAGYMRSEAIAVIFLQKAKDARRIYATYIYGKTNCDGFKQEGIMYPSVIVQKNLLQEFYDNCGVSPEELSFMEAHATGTVAGDQVEVDAIDQAICSRRTTPLLMGSVKSNLGHTEPTSGLCQVAKVLIAMETGFIPPNINYESPRKNMTAILENRIKINTELTPWKAGYVGINSFGFGGANCHVLLKSNPQHKILNESLDDLPRLVAVSGRTEEAVNILLDDITSRPLDIEYVALLHCLHTENIEGHSYRGYTITGSKTACNSINKVEISPSRKKAICFIFPGADVQWYNIDLMKLPVFAKAIEKCDAILKQHDICVTDILTSKNILIGGSILESFVATVAIQIGLVDLLTHVDIVPDYMIGYSVGDLICEYVDGRFTAKETILLAYSTGFTLQQFQIQVTDITGDQTKYLESVRSKLLEHISRLLPSQPSKGRGVNLLGKYPNDFNNSTAAIAQYYADNILYPVTLKKMLSSIPKNTVLVEIVPHSIFQSIITQSSGSTLKLISLFKHDQKNTVQDFLEGLGDLYNVGLQPQISNLYPPVQFPVSRGTPMISPLVRWDHSDDYYFYKYICQEKKVNREIDISISFADEEHEFMSGHVIDGRNLFPATGYLYLIWLLIGGLRGLNNFTLPIVFENVKFVRATHISKKDKLVLTFVIQKGSNNFEIFEGDNVVVSGVVRTPEDIANEKLPIQHLTINDDDDECMSTADIYKQLRLRGYQYAGMFRLLKSASINGSRGHIKWSTNWTTFMDNMLQMKSLSLKTRDLCVPTNIRKIIIDPFSHITHIQNLPVGEKYLPVRFYDSVDAIVCGGIEIIGFKATSISRRLTTAEPVHEEYRFIAHRDHAITSLKEMVQMSIHLALECYEMRNVKVIEYIDEDDKVLLGDLVIPVVEEVLNNIPLVRSNHTLVAAPNRFDSCSLPNNLTITDNLSIVDNLTEKDKFLMAVGVGILTKHTSFNNQLLSSVMAGGFVLSREKLCGSHVHSLLQRDDLNIILEKRTKQETLVLLRKAQKTIRIQNSIHISNYEFSWIDKLKNIMDIDDKSSSDAKIILVAEGDSECGILGFVNCLRQEAGEKRVACVFIQDKNAPEFSLQEPFYMEQLQLDLPINVLRPGKIWGSYRHILLPLPEPRPVQYGYVVQEIRGDLSTLHWAEGRVSPHVTHTNYTRIVYAALNFRDVMIATGKLALQALAPLHELNVDSFLGFEFVGLNGSRQRIMSLVLNRGLSNISMHDKYLSWVIPDEWTFEEAATIPCVYATNYYALYIIGKMKKGDKVLIHSGTGGIGQAAINLALHEGCEVFTTVGTLEKRQFIRESFPSIPDDHIGNSRDTSFEQMIVQQTHGRGVDIVLNSLAEEKLQASVRCLAKGGRFLEIGKYDLISDNVLDKMAFARGISFHGIMLDNLLSEESLISCEERRRSLSNYMTEGMRNGAIKPLPRKIFKKTEIEAAFRYMAAGKHIGKILIKIRDEDDPFDLPILAHPRFFCEDHKSYIILGGLGGFGLELADWLILRGARKLLLTSRSGIRNGYQRSRVELWKSHGVNIQIIVGADASDHNDCTFILNSANEMGPVDAIFNLAVVLKDSIYKNQTIETFEESFKPKAMATKTLDELSRKMCVDLRHFVVFSSVSCGRGNPGQTNYGMANSIMERICEKRVQDGLPGMAVQWGAVGDVGLVADMQEDNKELVIRGTLQQKIQSCLKSLDAFLVQSRPIVGSMVVAEKISRRGQMDILETVASIMGLKDVKMAGLNTPLSDIGMDSMIVVEIKQTLEREFNVYLNPQDIRNLTFAKLREMADENASLEKETKSSFVDIEGTKLLIQSLHNLHIVSNTCLELPTKQNADEDRIFFIPGIEGCGSIFNSIAPKIETPASCLQHGANNISTSDSVLRSAVTLLPDVLARIKNSAEFVFVGYSYGSLIAIELARLLEAKGRSGRLILIDGTPDQVKALKEQHFPFTTIQEFQNNVLLKLGSMFYLTDYLMILTEVSKYDTWEKKLDAFVKYIPDEFLRITSVENYKILFSSIYNHLCAIHEYDVFLLPPLKSRILLIKPTLSSLSFADEDCGLKKVTDGNVQIHYVKGNHITMLENNELADAINDYAVRYK